MVGTLDGNRVWSKDMNTALSHVEWAPDGRWILFGSGDGPVSVFNHQGVKIGNLDLIAISDVGSPVKLVGLEWYDGAEGYMFPDVPCLAVAFANGRVQIMREADDPKPVLLDTGLALVQCKWNSNGTVLALAGVRNVAGKETCEVQFYTPFGRYITTMKVPGGNVAALTWEGGGLRLAVCIQDAFSARTLSSSNVSTMVCTCSWLWTPTSSFRIFDQIIDGRLLEIAWYTRLRGQIAWSNALCSGIRRRMTGSCEQSCALHHHWPVMPLLHADISSS